MYQDDIEEANQFFETDSLMDRLAKTGINDLKEHSNVFDVQVFSSEACGPTFSITIANCTAVYDPRPLFEYKGRTSLLLIKTAMMKTRKRTNCLIISQRITHLQTIWPREQPIS